MAGAVGVTMRARQVTGWLLLALVACIGWAAPRVNAQDQDESYFKVGRVKPVFDGTVVKITPENVDEVLSKWHYIFVDFYADWCPYCRRLKPVWDQAALELKGTEDAAMAVIDCVAHADLAQRYGISKFPTMKMIRAGEMSQKEYRAARSAVAIKEFFHSEVDEESNHALSTDALEAFVEKGDKRIIVGFFTKVPGVEKSATRVLFEQVSDHMRDKCKFVEVHDPEIMKEYNVADGTILYKTDHDHALDEVFSPSSEEFAGSDLIEWAYKKCVPLVKEATRHNVEALAEEGKPFFIMFYDDQKDDGSSVRIFKQAIESRFHKERENFNFLYADGNVFTFPLQHIGKTKKDLPVVAIDTFQNIYQFGNFNCFAVMEKVENFINDFKSGSLHTKMHNGIYHEYECDRELDEIVENKDLIEEQIQEIKMITDSGEGDKESAEEVKLQVKELEHAKILSENHEGEQEEKRATRELAEEHGLDPDELDQELDNRVHDSVFAKLKPGMSERYSLRDEL